MNTKVDVNLFDIDAHIAKLSGRQDYMTSLKQITGDVKDLNMDFWKPRSERIVSCNNNIMKLLTYLAKVYEKRDANKYKDLIKVKNDYETEYNLMKLEKNALITDKKGRLHVEYDYRPENIIKSKWFSQLKDIEKTINKYVVDVLGKNHFLNQTDLDKFISDLCKEINGVLEKHPDFIDIKKIYGCEVNITANTLESFMRLREYATLIINIYMYPMYDVKKKIFSNYGKLDKMFKTKGAKQMLQGNNVTTNEIITILEQFIVAKYRKEMTGDAGHYANILMTLIGDEDVSSLSGPRLLELIDNIDFNIINSNKNAYKFATEARDMIKKLINGEKMNVEEAVRDVKRLFQENEEKPRVEEVEEDPEKNNIL